MAVVWVGLPLPCRVGDLREVCLGVRTRTDTANSIILGRVEAANTLSCRFLGRVEAADIIECNIVARVEAADIVPCSILGCEDAANIVIYSIWKSSRACKHSNMGSSSRARTYCNYNLAENCSASALSFPELADV